MQGLQVSVMKWGLMMMMIKWIHTSDAHFFARKRLVWAHLFHEHVALVDLLLVHLDQNMVVRRLHLSRPNRVRETFRERDAERDSERCRERFRERERLHLELQSSGLNYRCRVQRYSPVEKLGLRYKARFWRR